MKPELRENGTRVHLRRLLGRLLVCLTAGLPSGLAAVTLAELSSPAPEQVETGGGSLERVIGEVTATDPAAKQITVKMDAGGTVTVILQNETLFLRVPPGETDLKKAVKVTLADIGVGDRVYARGVLAEDRKSIPALAVIVMTKADLAQKHARERAEWQKRGVAGAISALNPETREITLSVRTRDGTRTLIIESSPNVVLRRYAPDSVRFGDAEPSVFAELKVGDSLRVLGERNANGTRMKPEEMVSGSFRNVAGIITAIDTAAHEIRITDLQTKKPLTVRIMSDTVLRRLPPTKPAAPASRPAEGGKSPAATANAGAAARPGEAPTQSAPPGTASRPAEGGKSPAAPAGTGSAGRPGEGPTQGGSPRQPEAKTSESAAKAPKSDAPGGSQLDVERMPVLPFGELKRDEAILVLCTAGTDPSRPTAIVMVAGIETLLIPGPEGQAQIGAAWNFFDISVP